MPFEFPDVSNASDEGLLAVGGRLNVQLLESAYRQGIFPWPVSERYPMTWFAPDPRGIIRPEKLHIGKSLKKFMAKNFYEIKINHDFELIIRQCAQIKRTHEQGTWIYPSLIDAYEELFKNNKAYCIGAYQGDKLVGGLYGVCFGEIISGESMFAKENNASKLCLIKLLELLKSAGIGFVDTQMTTPIIESMGGERIARKRFMELLAGLDPNRDRESIFQS